MPVPNKLVAFLLAACLLSLVNNALSAKQAVVSKKSKLCGNAACEEILFKSRVKRVMGVNNDPSFLNLAENAFISVVAVKFSDRPDIMEGRLNDDGPTGFFYAGAIDLAPFAEFLRTAIDEKKEMLMISQSPSDVGEKRVVGVVHSETDLVRDYNARSAEAAREAGLPPPEPLPIPEPTGGHGHSHSGHGHSHGAHGHSHSHSHPAPTPPPAPVVPEIAEVPPAVPVVPVVPKVPATPPVPVPEELKAAEININNVLGTPPTLPPNGELPKTDEMDAEIERLIQEEAAKYAKAPEEAKKPEEVTQPPLVLTSLPDEPVTPPTPIAEEPPVPPVVEFHTTIPTPIQEEPLVPVQAVTPPPIVEEPTTTPAPIPVSPVQEPISQYIPEPEPVVQEPVTPPPVVEEPVTPPPVVEEPVTPPPVVEEPVTPPPVVEEPVTPPPVVEEPVTPPPVVEEPVTPPPVVEEPVAVPTEASPVPVPVEEELTTTPPPPSPIVENKSQEEEDFQKWEEERKKREVAQPYEDAYAQQFKHLPASPPVSAGLIDFIRTSFGLGNVTDASVILYLNLTFFVASLLLYVIVRSLSSFSDSDVLDRQAYMNLVTKYKQLETQLHAKNAEIQKLQSSGVQQKQQTQQPNHESELLALRQQVSQLHTELQIAHSQRQEFEIHFNELRSVSEQKEQQIVALNEQIADYSSRLERSSGEAREWAHQLETARAEVNATQQSAFSHQQELVRQQQEQDATQKQIQELTSEVNALQTRISQLEQVNDQLDAELREAKIEKSSLVETIQQLELEKSQNDVGSSPAESGGSGWSDFGDEVEEEKTPDASNNELVECRAKLKKHEEDLKELATLKGKLKEVEKELNTYKTRNEKENSGKTETSSKLRRAEEEVAEAKKKVEQLETEKNKLDEDRRETLKLLNSLVANQTSAATEASTMKAEIANKDKQLKEAENALRTKEEELQDAKAECKRVQKEYRALETKSFHDVLKMKKELDQFKMQQIRMSPAHVDMLRPPSDRQIIADDEPPIWDEPDFGPSHVMPPQLQQEDYFSSSSQTMPTRRRSSRRSLLPSGIGGELSPSDREEKSGKSKKEGVVVHRRRSRSHGRQMPIYQDQYGYGGGAMGPMYGMPGSSDSSFMSGHLPPFHPLRHSKSGHVNYSSGGSNGPTSPPPPEMPLLGAIPPPGARKPISKRAGPNIHGK
ncbi:unnamed protein product [Caenorhabditis sp. 36 PRJEB53466]|nr:unnamed protein product [Caenorhabditis sp. 36 PRJEB53466]